MIKCYGGELAVVGGGGARGVAAGTGDNTAAKGGIVDKNTFYRGLFSGVLFVAGQATLADTESIDINDVMIEHGDVANLSDAAEYTFGAPSTDFAAVKTSDGGTTETFEIKLDVDLTGLKQYFRVSVTPNLSASGTDTFELGFGIVAIGGDAPQT